MTGAKPVRNRRRSKAPKESGSRSIVTSPDKEGVSDAMPQEDDEGVIEVLPAEAKEIDIVEDDESMSDVVEEETLELGSSTKSLVRYDTVSAYLSEIGRYPHLSREEETELAIRFYENKDLEAAYRLITSNLWLVVKIAREYERAARSLLDVVQEGNIGLMEAVKNFDPYRGVRFPSYAVWWIKAYIIRFVIANWRLVKLGTTQAQRKLFFNLKKEKERLEREGFRPEPKLLAEKLNVKESEIVEMEQRLSASDLSVDVPLGEDSDSNMLSFMPSDAATAEDLLARRESQQLLTSSLDEFAATLKERELIIFKERMLGEEKATLHELAEKLSVSKERVRQIEQKLRDRLREFMVQKLGSSLDGIDLN